MPWQPIKISDLDKIHVAGRGLLQKHFCKTFFKISAVTEINANFHFSHYKSTGTLSCHTNESTWATTMKNIIYVEANVMNMYANFKFHPLHSFRGEDFFNIFFENLPFILPWQPIKFSDLDKIHMNRRGLLKKHFCKKKI